MTTQALAPARRHAKRQRKQERNRIVRAQDEGPCPYCSRTYQLKAASVHFIPCAFCDSLEHAGCQH